MRKIRFALTHINREGIRALTRANQGANHFDTKEQAEAHFLSFLKNNTQKLLEQVYGRQAFTTFEIRPVKCYDSGDAIDVYFDN